MFTTHTTLTSRDVPYHVWQQGNNRDIIMMRKNDDNGGSMIVVFFSLANELYMFYFSFLEITSDHSLVFGITCNQNNIVLVPRFLDNSEWENTFDNDVWCDICLQSMLGDCIQHWFGLPMLINAVEEEYQSLHDSVVRTTSDIVKNAINYYDVNCLNGTTNILHCVNHGQAPR